MPVGAASAEMLKTQKGEKHFVLALRNDRWYMELLEGTKTNIIGKGEDIGSIFIWTFV